MQVRRFLAPAVWVTATVTAAALVSGAVRLAVRSVAPPAAAARLPGPHQKAPAPQPSTAATQATGEAAAPSGVENQRVLPVTEGETERTTATAGPPATVHGATRPPAPDLGSTATTTGPGPSSSAPPSSGSSTPSSSTTTTSTTRPPSPSSSTTTTSTSTTSTTQATDVYSSDGGSVGVKCNGDSASLVFASPNNGYRYDDQSTADVVDVNFIGSRATYEIRVTCSGGQSSGQVIRHARD